MVCCFSCISVVICIQNYAKRIYCIYYKITLLLPGKFRKLTLLSLDFNIL